MTFIIGASNADNFNGTDSNDIILSFAGNDVLRGGAGNDLLFGNLDHDRLYGEDGKDWLFGGLGTDLLRGGNDDDFLAGGSGVDQLDGDDGNDRLNGGSGNDRLFGDLGDDVLYGGDGDDSLNGGGFDDVEFTGDDRLYGGNGNDNLVGAFGNDHLNGGNGDDILNGAGGNGMFGGRSLGANEIDTLTGGARADTFVLFGAVAHFGNSCDYDFNGENDYALITDFDKSLDVIQLIDKQGGKILLQYSIGASPSGLPAGAAIFYEFADILGTTPELIAILQNVTPDSLSISAPYFNIKQT